MTYTRPDEGYRTTYTRPVDLKKLTFIHRSLERAVARSVVELGCGTGQITTSLKGFDRVLGVELFESEAAVARANGVDVVVADACTWNGGETFDAVIASEVFTNVVDPAALAANARTHLSTGGLFVVTSLNGYGPYELRGKHLSVRYRLRQSRLLRKLTGKDPFAAGGMRRAQFFTLNRLTGIIEQAGFRLVDRANSDFLTGSTRDIAIADRLPAWAVSGWYLTFEAV